MYKGPYLFDFIGSIVRWVFNAVIALVKKRKIPFFDGFKSEEKITERYIIDFLICVFTSLITIKIIIFFLRE